MNAVFRVPPSFLAAALVSSSGLRRVSRRRLSDRCVHTGEWAASTSLSWLITPLTVRARVAPAVGIWVGSASRSRYWRLMPMGMRRLPVTTSRTVSTADGGGAGSASPGSGTGGIGGSSASRARSMNCIDSRRLPSPSATVWCSFWMMAPWPPSSPSTTKNAHSGRVRSKGSAAISVARSHSCRSVPGSGRATWRTW